MSELELMISFYKNIPRQGPGSPLETTTALKLTGMDLEQKLKVADIGCGTGSQTFTLAEYMKGHIFAIDIFPEFLDKLQSKAVHENLKSQITTDIQSMDKLPYKNISFDLIWSEGAIYIMGFEEGVKAWRPLLRPGGFLVVSEISWFTDSRPKDLETYWYGAYSQIDTMQNKSSILERYGFRLVSSFKLPEYCWIENYYNPIRDYIPEFLEMNKNSSGAKKLVDELTEEIEMYEKYKDFYGYGFYIAQKK